MCWNKGRLCWKIAKLFYFSHLKKLVKPETFEPYYMSKTMKPVRASLFTLEDTAHSTDFPGLRGARATCLNGNILVYMAWWDLRSTFISLTRAEGGMDLLDVAAKCRAHFVTRFWSQGAKGTDRWLLSGSIYGLCCLPGLTPHTFELSLGPGNNHAFIFTNGSTRNPRCRAKQKEPLNDGCTTPCELCLLRR